MKYFTASKFESVSSLINTTYQYNYYDPRDSKMLKMNKINIVMLQKKVTT
jgi:hypothetical protein